VTIGQPIFVFRQCAVAEEFGVVFGGEIIAEGRSLFSAILQKNSDGINHANDEDKGADEEQGIHEVDHKCSPCAWYFRNRQEEGLSPMR
jgi:hypothetical protein